MSSVAVIGAGAWGTALAIQAARAGNAVTLWARDPARAEAIRASRENPRLPGIRLPEPILATSAMPHDGRCGPAGGSHAASAPRAGAPSDRPRAVWWSVPKAWNRRRCACRWRLSADVRPGTPSAILTGPNFAHEIAAGLPAAAAVAASDAGLRTSIAALLGTPSFRLYGNDDPIGAQVGGAAKNVIAIAAGAVIGAGLGENARAALITRGLAELSRLAVALGGRAETMMGLSGLGDLLLTCTGPASRNYSLGLALGRGERLPTSWPHEVPSPRVSPRRPPSSHAPPPPDRRPGQAWICRSAPRSRRCWPDARRLAEAITALLARPRRDE